MDLAQFRKKPLLGILRGVSEKFLDPLLETIFASGLETIEFAMNTPGAAALIRRAVRRYGKKLMIGAGTVSNTKDLKAALQSGATFIVSPVFVVPVVQYCVRHKVPVFPGALTPLEIYQAWQAGATMVKVFPARCFGPNYFKEIKGPFPEIKLLACSGVTPQDMKTYFQNGADAIAVGSSVFRSDWIAEKKFHSIRQRIQTYLKALGSL